MTDEKNTPIHVPTPQFRASLENEIIHALRREARMESDPPSIARPQTRTRRRDRIKLVAVLTIGLILGVGTQFASAQDQDARQRTLLESTLQVDRDVAMLRLQVAQESHERAQREFAAGVISREALLDAAADLRTAQVAVMRADLNLEEARLASAAPRDELWAPRLGERDFVTERLRLEAAAAQERMKSAEAMAAESERRSRAGLTMPSDLDEAGVEAAEAKREFQLVAQRLMLREAFLTEELTPEEVTRRERRAELMSDVELVQRRLQLATTRLERAREKAAVGAATELAVKRAEVDVLEGTLQLKRLELELNAMRSQRP